MTAVVLALCACNPAYQRPSSPDTATASIRFIAEQHKGFFSSISIYAHASDDCGTPKKIVGLGGGPFNFGGGRKEAGDIGMSKESAVHYQLGQYFETKIVSGTPFHFTVAGGENRKVCYVSGSFLPEAGAEYEAIYNTDAAYCYLSLEKIRLEDSHFTRLPEPSFMQRKTACTFFWN